MNSHRAWLIYFFFFCIAALPVLAAVDAAAGTSSLDLDVNGLLAGFLEALARDHSWMVTVTLVMGIFRILNKPFFTLLHWYVASTPGKADDEWLERLERSAWLRWLAWLLDLFLSIKVVPVTPAQRKIAEAIRVVGK